MRVQPGALGEGMTWAHGSCFLDTQDTPRGGGQRESQDCVSVGLPTTGDVSPSPLTEPGGEQRRPSGFGTPELRGAVSFSSDRTLQRWPSREGRSGPVVYPGRWGWGQTAPEGHRTWEVSACARRPWTSQEGGGPRRLGRNEHDSAGMWAEAGPRANGSPANPADVMGAWPAG